MVYFLYQIWIYVPFCRILCSFISIHWVPRITDYKLWIPDRPMSKTKAAKKSIAEFFYNVNYHVKNLSNNHSNENIKTGVSREIIIQ